MKKKTIVILIIVVVILVLAVRLLQKRKAEISNATLPSSGVVTVSVVKAKQGTMQYKIPFLAQIVADKSITLSTKLAGYVEKVYVEESQKVTKGEILVRIDAFELNSNIDALQATLNAQENDLNLAKKHTYKK
ncbi:MAG: biotin/lipoyl-binding protein [Sulfurovum sp.]|nr:biotin/lipoyl-binding protein [Sulfurovum sp.]